MPFVGINNDDNSTQTRQHLRLHFSQLTHTDRPKLFHACSVILLRFYLDQCIKSIIPEMQNSDLAANIIRLRFMAICELLLRQMYGPSSGVLRMEADNDRSL